jgi:hypothetical protein
LVGLPRDISLEALELQFTGVHCRFELVSRPFVGPAAALSAYAGAYAYRAASMRLDASTCDKGEDFARGFGRAAEVPEAALATGLPA